MIYYPDLKTIKQVAIDTAPAIDWDVYDTTNAAVLEDVRSTMVKAAASMVHIETHYIELSEAMDSIRRDAELGLSSDYHQELQLGERLMQHLIEELVAGYQLIDIRARMDAVASL